MLLLFSHSVMSNSFWPHGLQHTRLPCPSPAPRAYSNSCPLRSWEYCFKEFIRDGLNSTKKGVLYTSNRKSTLIENPNNEGSEINDILLVIGHCHYSALQNLKPMLFRVFIIALNSYGSKSWSLVASAFFTVQLLHPYMTRKNQSFDHTDFDWPDFGHSIIYVVLFYFNL